jgi:hypothetical protein
MNQHLASLILGLAAQANQALDGQLPAGVPGGASSRDVAKALIDTLGMLEQKTKGNLDADEQRLLTEALNTVRFRFISSDKPVQ